jgi:hypothetical protein
MTWLFAIVGLLAVVVIALVLVGRETARLAASARPAIFDVARAVEVIAERLPERSQARLTHDDVRWVLLADADLLEDATADLAGSRLPWNRPAPRHATVLPEDTLRVPGGDGDEQVVDEDLAVARLLAMAEAAGRPLEDEDVAAVLAARMVYLEEIGAVGGAATMPTDSTA